MGSTGDFPFDIEQVASLLPIKIRRPVANAYIPIALFAETTAASLK